MQDAAAEITRCICGHDELQTDDPDIDSGLFIQCDKCQVWQHAYCVGIGPDDNLTDDYSCEKCRPELHLVVVRPTGKTSKYIPLLEAKQPRPKERSSRHSSRSDQSSSRRSNSSSTSTANPESSHKRRSTLNSRDSAYEEVLRRVLEVSAHETSGGVGASDTDATKSGRSMRGKKRAAQAAFEGDEQEQAVKREDDNEDEEEMHQHRRRRRIHGSKQTHDDEDSRSSEEMKMIEKEMKDESTENGNNEEVGDNNESDEDDEEDISDDVVARRAHRSGHNKSSIGKRDRGKRSRATQSPSETGDENQSSRRSRNGRATSSSTKNSRMNGSPDENEDEDEDAESEENSKSRASPDDLHVGVETTSLTPDEKPVSLNKKETDEEDVSKASTKGKPAPATTLSNITQSRNRRSRKQQTMVDRDDDTDTSTATGRATSVGTAVEKPSKPRIPQGKSSIVEMRKRVAAILEFIGRTQVDMAIEQDERKKLHSQRRKPGSPLTSSVSTSATATASAAVITEEDEIDTLFGTQKISLEMMDGLTRKLLIWEQQFGRHGDKN
ncbi:uncharacterized protein V1513DRAFT_439636 [Lipomyces chichibuensis]|uniref:uncharacterized protein n=1 Tax=Lipomyces chichibuensis TaxID=1546026 RepID=UPI00334398EF